MLQQEMGQLIGAEQMAELEPWERGKEGTGRACKLQKHCHTRVIENAKRQLKASILVLSWLIIQVRIWAATACTQQQN